MRPFHPVDLFELAELHVRVEQLELGRGAVLVELDLPGGGGAGWEGAGDGSPFGDAEPGFGEAGEAAKDDDAEDAGGAGEEPVGDGFVTDFGKG